MSYKAVTKIKYSDPKAADGPVEIVEFEVGETVSGLPKDVMKDLWEAGALEKVEDAPAPKSESKTEEPPPPPPSE